uniref:Neur_chan_LBD domain-containing protein n=1 Tax=Heterorhabditis bacteriophora TaxID=37862 RepID=A0A1I7WEN8_HETBA
MSGLFGLLCLHIFTYNDSWTKQRLIVRKVELAIHTQVHYLLIAEICIYLDERWTSTFLWCQLHDVDWSREIMKPIQRRCNPIHIDQYGLLFSLKLKIWAFVFQTIVFKNWKHQFDCSFWKADVYHDFNETPYPTGYTDNPYAKLQKLTVVQSISLLIAISDRGIIFIARIDPEKTTAP